MTVNLCAVCDGPMPPPKSRGRRAEFCSMVCRQRAAIRRRRAARLLEYAMRLQELADGPRLGEVRFMESAERMAERAEGLRERAREELRGLPL